MRTSGNFIPTLLLCLVLVAIQTGCGFNSEPLRYEFRELKLSADDPGCECNDQGVFTDCDIDVSLELWANKKKARKRLEGEIVPVRIGSQDFNPVVKNGLLSFSWSTPTMVIAGSSQEAQQDVLFETKAPDETPFTRTISVASQEVTTPPKIACTWWGDAELEFRDPVTQDDMETINARFSNEVTEAWDVYYIINELDGALRRTDIRGFGLADSADNAFEHFYASAPREDPFQGSKTCEYRANFVLISASDKLRWKNTDFGFEVMNDLRSSASEQWNGPCNQKLACEIQADETLRCDAGIPE